MSKISFVGLSALSRLWLQYRTAAAAAAAVYFLAAVRGMDSLPHKYNSNNQVIKNRKYCNPLLCKTTKSATDMIFLLFFFRKATIFFQQRTFS